MSADTADPDLQEAIKRGLVKPVAAPQTDDPDVQEAIKRGLIKSSGAQYELTQAVKPAEPQVSQETPDPTAGPGYTRNARKHDLNTLFSRTTRDDGSSVYDVEEGNVSGPLAPATQVLKGLGETAKAGRGLSTDKGRNKGVGGVYAKALETTGGAAALPFSTAMTAAPEPVKQAVEAPFQALDEYVAKPLSLREEKLAGGGSRIVSDDLTRAGVNVFGGTAAAYGAFRGTKALSEAAGGYRADRVSLTDLDPVSSAYTAQARRGAAYPDRYSDSIPGQIANTRPGSGGPIELDVRRTPRTGATPNEVFQDAGADYAPRAEIRPPTEAGVVPENWPQSVTARPGLDNYALLQVRKYGFDTIEEAVQAVRTGEQSAQVLPNDLLKRILNPNWPSRITNSGSPTPTRPMPAQFSETPSAPAPYYETPRRPGLGLDYSEQIVREQQRTPQAELASSGEPPPRTIEGATPGAPAIESGPGGAQQLGEPAPLPGESAGVRPYRRVRTAPGRFREVSDRPGIELVNSGSPEIPQGTPPGEAFNSSRGETPFRTPERSTPPWQRGVPLEAQGEPVTDVAQASVGGAPGGPSTPGGPGTPPGGQNAPRGSTPLPVPSQPGGRVSGFNEKIGNLRGYSEKLFYSVKQALSEKSRDTAGFIRDFTLARKRLSPDEVKGLTPAFMRGEGRGTPGQEAFRDSWRGTQEQLRNYINKSGVRIVENGKPRELNQNPSYFPQDPKPEVIQQIETNPAYKKAYMEEAARQGLSPKEAQDVLTTYTEPGLRSFHAGSETARTFIWPDEWVNKDVLSTIDKHIHGAVANAVEHRIFKYRDPMTGEAMNPDLTGRPQGDLGSMLAELPRNEQPSAERLVKDLLGRDPEKWGSAHQRSMKTSSFIGALNAIRLYAMRPTTAILQQTQHAMTNALVGEDVMAGALKQVATDPKGVYDRALRSGAVRPHSQYSDVVGIQEEVAGQGMHKAAEVALTPMALSDMSARLVASATAEGFAQKLTRQLNGSPREAQIARVNLESLDYSPEQIEQFKSGTPDVEILRQRIVERTQGEVTNASRIPFAASDKSVLGISGRVLMQGKNFSVAQARNTWRIAGRQLIQANNPLPVMRLAVGSYLVGKGVMAAKDLLTGPSDSRPDDIPQTLKEGSFGGITGDAANAAIRSEGDVSKFLDHLTESQWEGLLRDTERLVHGTISPPHDKNISLGGISLDVRKSRTQVLQEYLQRAVPSAREWLRIENRLFGDDSIVQSEQGKKAQAEFNRAKSGRVPLEVR